MFLAVPAGEEVRALLGSLTMLSGRELTKEECLKRLKDLSVGVVRDVFLYPKVISGILKGIKNIPKIKKVAQGICKVVKECKATRLAAGKVVGKIGSVGRSIEQILPRMKTFEQARNKALKLVGNMGAGSIPWIGGMEKSAGFGKIVGRLSKNKKKGWRLDWDPKKGIHINVADFTVGRKSLARKYGIPCDGNEDMFKSLLKHLNR